MTVYHVRYRDTGKWAVEKRGASRASFVGSEAMAKSKARKMADTGDTLVLHNPDGSVSQRKSVTDTTNTLLQSVSRSIGNSPFDV